MLLKVKILGIINAHRISWKDLLSLFKKKKKNKGNFILCVIIGRQPKILQLFQLWFQKPYLPQTAHVFLRNQSVNEYKMLCAIWYHLYSFHPATLLKVTLLHGCFSCFLKLYKWYQITQIMTIYLPSM